MCLMLAAVVAPLVPLVASRAGGAVPGAVGDAVPLSATEPVRAEDRVMVLISVDGLAGFYFDDPRAEMPNIRALAAEGAKAPLMRASTPSVTWPNHTTLVTGDHPARHGVVGNNYFDREAGKQVALIQDPIFDKDQIVRVPTIYDIAKSAGLRTAALGWPATRNARTLDWTVPDTKGDILDQYTTPSLLAECLAAHLWPEVAEPAAGNPGPTTGPARDGVRPIGPPRAAMTEEMLTDIFGMILERHRPNLALLHISFVDHTEHQYGPRSPEAYAAIRAADERVGRVWAQLRRDYPGRATMFVVSDHGFSPIEHAILPNVILREAGLTDVKGLRVVGGDVRVVSAGGAALVYVLNDARRAEIVARMPALFGNVEGVASVVGPEGFAELGVADPKLDPHAPDVILFAKEGYSFGSTAAGAMTQLEKPEIKGTHGHDTRLPDLHAIFVAWGVGIRPGAVLGEISNTDVAPTIAAIMGLPMPDVDGKVLREALVNQP